MPRAKRPCVVVTFRSAHAAMSAELACREEGLLGRIIPVPVDIAADCGLAWSMPSAVRGDFEALAARRQLDVQGIYELDL